MLKTNIKHSRYFDDDYKPKLVDLAKGILAEKNGITLNELVLDIANLHGLSRTSKKQLSHMNVIIGPWAGVKTDGTHKPVVWSSREEIVDEMLLMLKNPENYKYYNEIIALIKSFGDSKEVNDNLRKVAFEAMKNQIGE